MTFQASNYKEKNFLDLKNNNNLSTRPTYSKGSTWLKHIEHSNMLCVYVTKAIANHTLISEYYSQRILCLSI